MTIKLCYKEYDYKVNLGACKSFYEQTGKDLNFTLLRFLDACRVSGGEPTENRLTTMFGLESFSVIAKLFHCIIKQKQKDIPLAEIEDAMFRVGWMPTDEDSDLCNPWPLVVVSVATEVSEYYSALDKKKAIT